MATLRIANKIHCIVYNVVLRSPAAASGAQRAAASTTCNQLEGAATAMIGGSRAHSSSPAPTPTMTHHCCKSGACSICAATGGPATRYPLNQQDANSYIDQLRVRSALAQDVDPEDDGATVVRTFIVDLNRRAHAHYGASFGGRGPLSVRLYSKSGKDCEPCEKPKPACKKQPETKKCKKMDDQCTSLKLDNCKQSKMFVCRKHPYVFRDVLKQPAPYPCFSEACYEEPPPTISECKDCPWARGKHPTYKEQKPKFGKLKKKFHTDARRFVTLRFGTDSRADERDKQRQAEIDSQKLYDSLNEALFMRNKAQQAHTLRLAPLPRDLDVEIGLKMMLMKRRAMQEVPPTPTRAPRGMLLYEQRKSPHDMPKNQLGTPPKHKMRRKKHPRCPPHCLKLPYKPPKYDMEKRRRRPKPNDHDRSICDCSGATPRVAAIAEAEGMLCKMRKGTKNEQEGGRCEVLDRTKVSCPAESVLRQKPYPKYRKAMKKRLKWEKKYQEKRDYERKFNKDMEKMGKKTKKATLVGNCAEMALASSASAGFQNAPRQVRPHQFRRRRIESHKLSIPKSAIVRGRNKAVPKFSFKPLPEHMRAPDVTYMTELEQRAKEAEAKADHQAHVVKALETLKNIMLFKNRIRVTGPQQCPESCHKKQKKQECPIKIRSKVCPKSLLIRKPRSKCRKRKGDCCKRRKHRKSHQRDGGRGQKRRTDRVLAAAEEEISEEEMTGISSQRTNSGETSKRV